METHQWIKKLLSYIFQLKNVNIETFRVTINEIKSKYAYKGVRVVPHAIARFGAISLKTLL